MSKYTPYGYRKPYGIGAFILDVLLIIFTAGFGLVWIFVREMRNR